MAVHGDGVAATGGWLRRLQVFLEMIKFEHTLLALPFALISMLLAARHAGFPRNLPAFGTIAWILAAMVGARSAAMAFNRLVDASYDARNPRTAARALPAGLLTSTQVWGFTLAAVLLFLTAAYMLNPLCFALAPLALVLILGYSYTKRFTALSHLALGLGIGAAPVGAWIAVTGTLQGVPVLLGCAVMLWIAGFDIIYALQDESFDRSAGLHSLPQRLGASRALMVSRLLHLGMVALLVWLGAAAGLGVVYFLGVAGVAMLIAYEHSLVSPGDLSRVNMAFFTLNGWISIGLFCFVAADLFWLGGK